MTNCFHLPFLTILSLFIFLQSCSKEEQGKRLAIKHCSSCHKFPEPALLDKQTWKSGVLPEMAFRMGVDYSSLAAFPENEIPTVLRALPGNPMISQEEWQKIADYFIQNAPDSLVLNNAAVSEVVEIFSPIKIKLAWPHSTLLSRDTLQNQTYYGTRDNVLYRLNDRFEIEESLNLPSPPSDIIHSKNEHILLTMGIMDPNDVPAGKMSRLKSGAITAFIDSLQRPVSFNVVDLNNDNLDDYVVCAFGHFTGGLLAFEQTQDGTYRKHVLQHLPGARKVVVRDFDKNGLPDLLVLMTQGDEKIIMLYNQGNMRFRIKTLLRFPPVYGSSYFEIHDFNADGMFDILYSNGDNGDYSTILKPYHGIRLFLNDGTNRFNQDWFYPMPGASKVIARDFDNDGDLDIAAISFFPDFNYPETGFLYLENQLGDFIPKMIPEAASGRWIVMEEMDINNDGSLDLVLGALNFSTAVPASLVRKWNDDPVSLLVLENRNSGSVGVTD